VPAERPVPTTKLEVVLPTDHPVPSVSVKSLPGWQCKTETAKLPKPVKTDDGDEITEAITKITWTGGKIAPGEFQEFDVSMGPLPTDTDKLTFKVLQTYADGDVVRWIQTAQEGQPEPENPAPVLTFTPASGEEHGKTAPAGTEQAATTTAADSSTSDTTTRTLAILGLVAGLGVAILALRRRAR